eukprot:gnl/MRDRNA2_/MRDRNA2_82733_c0_seq1.p1 gnl/MRDRNA2_/MRDRNA2_82733_c0~~gnl/MRDRNA2_/MRDRNA2_82733_c0_seq1.p1  ORF type:complete len:446 (-),score=59.28 gnl/MRDRNA2_/MRDRNA2_82733_c0_seq1:415-1752(-)
MEWHAIILIAFATPAELLLACNHLLCFWVVIALTALLYSYIAAAIALLAALLAWAASMNRRAPELARYKGKFDMLLGRTYRASKLTPGMPANNNVSVASFGNDIVIAYRTAETHFASPSAKITVATSRNLEDWQDIWEYSTGQDDLREVLLWEFKGKLFLYYCCLEPHKRGFAPKGMHWTSTTNLKLWTDHVGMGRKTEITWDVKVNEGVAYKVGYVGNHYGAGDSVVSVVFECSNDGETWKPVGKDMVVYRGGISEVSFAFTAKGDLVAIGRNEDGDHTGFGSQLFFAPKNDLGSWVPLKVSLPHRFDSPRMLVMQGEVVLFARYARDPYNVVPQWMASCIPFTISKIVNLVVYSAKPKSSAVYRLDLPDNQGAWPKDSVQLVRCFEDSFGDTGFFSVAKISDKTDEWVVANYASASCHSHAPWFYGQVYATNIYVCRCMPMLR